MNHWHGLSITSNKNDNSCYVYPLIFSVLIFIMIE